MTRFWLKEVEAFEVRSRGLQLRLGIKRCEFIDRMKMGTGSMLSPTGTWCWLDLDWRRTQGESGGDSFIRTDNLELI